MVACGAWCNNTSSTNCDCHETDTFSLGTNTNLHLPGVERHAGGDDDAVLHLRAQIDVGATFALHPRAWHVATQPQRHRSREALEDVGAGLGWDSATMCRQRRAPWCSVARRYSNCCRAHGPQTPLFQVVECSEILRSRTRRQRQQPPQQRSLPRSVRQEHGLSLIERTSRASVGIRNRQCRSCCRHSSRVESPVQHRSTFCSRQTKQTTNKKHSQCSPRNIPLNPAAKRSVFGAGMNFELTSVCPIKCTTPVVPGLAGGYILRSTRTLLPMYTLRPSASKTSSSGGTCASCARCSRDASSDADSR